MLSEKISAIPRVDNGGPPRQGGWQEKRPFGGGLRRSNLEGRRGWRAKLLRAGKKGLREAREYGYNFYSWVSLTREIICSEEIKTKMQSKWPAVTQGNPEVQIIPLRAFYSTWLSAHKVWHAAFVILLSAWAPACAFARGWQELCPRGFEVTTAVPCGLFCLYRKLKGWAPWGTAVENYGILTLRDYYIAPFWEINVLYSTEIILKTYEKKLKVILNVI